MPAVQSNYDPLLMKNFQALACSLQPKLDTSVLQADGEILKPTVLIFYKLKVLFGTKCISNKILVK